MALLTWLDVHRHHKLDCSLWKYFLKNTFLKAETKALRKYRWQEGKWISAFRHTNNLVKLHGCLGDNRTHKLLWCLTLDRLITSTWNYITEAFQRARQNAFWDRKVEWLSSLLSYMLPFIFNWEELVALFLHCQELFHSYHFAYQCIVFYLLRFCSRLGQKCCCSSGQNSCVVNRFILEIFKLVWYGAKVYGLEGNDTKCLWGLWRCHSALC